MGWNHFAVIVDKKPAVIAIASVAIATALYIYYVKNAYVESIEFTVTLIIALIAVLVSRIRNNDRVKLFLLSLGSFAGIRFLWWRYNNSLNFDGIPNTIATLLLVSAESYTVLIFLMFAFQVSVLREQDETETEEKPATSSASYTPSVDIFIATYNEDNEILRRTISGCLSVGYSNKKIYVLDDGRRESVLDLAMSFGVEYLTRPNNKNAKAGNLNNALINSSSEFVLFLDADHVPAANIINICLAEMEKDENLALVQCAHRFMNPGPVERNLRLEGRLPHEQELFFQLVQVGKNAWNAAFFAGSAALIRRSAIEKVGGIPTETIAEDCELTILLHKHGYRSVYLSNPGILGLNPETLASYLIQQRRWARGSAQLWRLKNPIFLKGLSMPQRICYTAGMLHFLYGIPRLIYIITPCLFLLLGLCPMKVDVFDYIVFVAPYLLLYLLNQNYIFKNFRHSFWSDVYEVINAPNLALYTTKTLIAPRDATFQVTPKGIMLRNFCFNLGLVIPHFFILGICTLAYFGSVVQLSLGKDVAGVFVNLMWNTYNVLILISAICVSIERPQSRRAHRINRRMPITVGKLPFSDEPFASGETRDLNEYGARLALMRGPTSVARGERVVLHFDYEEGLLEVPATVVRTSDETKTNYGVHLKFDDLSNDPKTLVALINAVYTSNTEWKTLTEPDDAISSSLFTLLISPINTIQNLMDNRKRLSIAVPTNLMDAKLWDWFKGVKPLIIDESSPKLAGVLNIDQLSEEEEAELLEEHELELLKDDEESDSK